MRLDQTGLSLLLRCSMVFIMLLGSRPAVASTAEALFRFGANSYGRGEYAQAAGAFSQSATLQPTGGTLRNLGNAEWQGNRPGLAILAWEQALWINPFDSDTRQNLHFARRVSQLEAPELSWDEVVSSWLPATWWAWVAGLSLWTTVAISTVPSLMRLRKATWHQVVAAFGLAIFLLSVPAHLGVASRSRLGFITAKDVPLRLTPTAEAQIITHLPAGEPARLERGHGNYLLIQASHTSGWVRRQEFKLVCSTPGASNIEPGASVSK